MYITMDDELLELLRLALIHSNEKATFILVKRAADERVITLMRLQYFMNHLKGLCHGCSHCCEDIDTIRVNIFDVERMAAYLKMPIKKFINKYVKTIKKNGMVLWKTKPCVFLRQGRCTIYPVRPTMCVVYPFFGDLQSDFIKRRKDAITIPRHCTSGLRAYTLDEKIRTLLQEKFPTEKAWQSFRSSLLRRWSFDVNG